MLCAGLNDPRAIDLWSARNVVREHLHRAGQDQLVDDALGQLASAGVTQTDPCARLAALDSWRSLAISRGWLPQKLPSESWHANVDVVLRGSGHRSHRVPALVNAVGGALAVHGFTLQRADPWMEGEPCQGVDCVEGQDVSGVSTDLGILVIEVTETPQGLNAGAQFFLRNQRGQVNPPRPISLVLSDSGSSAAFDAAIWTAVEEALKDAPETSRR